MDGQVPSINTDDEISSESQRKPTQPQREWLVRGLSEPGGKLPLFDYRGQKISSRTVESCIKYGWAEPWFENPIKPDWQVCKITNLGKNINKESL